ncbi:MAG: SsgA family sporulation/cell division regulator [Actinomycetota bacterium]|nr:SsgA family sporulation/cell division regulator [Actinomycetota bacterium]
MNGFGVATQPVTVTDTAMMLVSAPGHPMVDAELRYTTQQPFCVQLSLSLDDSPAVEWVFARDLVIQGVRLPAGHGDIQLYPVDGGVIIELHSPDGDAHLLANSIDLTTFADTIEKAVPLGRESEFYSLDAELASLLAMSWRRPETA